MKNRNQLLPRLITLPSLILILHTTAWAQTDDNAGPQSCGEFVSQVMGPGYTTAQSEPTGNGGTRCYYKSTSDDGPAVSYGVIWPREDVTPPEEQQASNENATATNVATAKPESKPADKPKQCNYEFKQSAEAMGDDQLANLLCATASNDSPSFRIYPIRKDGGLGKQLTEIDALRGKTWYECKCGYLSTVKGAAAGNKNALNRFTGPDGIDKKIRTQIQIASECGYEYNLVVANQTVEDFFRNRYSDAKVIRVAFDACE